MGNCPLEEAASWRYYQSKIALLLFFSCHRYYLHPFKRDHQFNFMVYGKKNSVDDISNMSYSFGGGCERSLMSNDINFSID